MNTHAQPLTIKAALEKGIQTARQCPEHKRNQEKAAALLTDFFEHHGVTMWNDLQVDHIREYVADLEARHVSPNTIRAYTNPLRLAHRATRQSLSADYLRLRDILPPRLEPGKMYLTAKQALTALKLCDKHAERAGYVCLALGAMAGLRITEAAALTPESYDPIRRTIATGAKNGFSVRVVPLCKAAADILEWHFKQPPANRKNKGKGYDPTYCSRSVRRILHNAYDRTSDDCYKMVAPRDAGRKSLMNLLHDMDVSENMIRAYCGQAPERWDTLARHYLALIPKPTGPTHIREHAIEKLEKTVVAALEKYF